MFTDKQKIKMVCILCKKEIDDHGNLFCSKCRKKDWKKRFMALRKIHLQKMRAWTKLGLTYRGGYPVESYDNISKRYNKYLRRLGK